MSEGSQGNRIETFLYDAEGNRTEDESVAVRGEVVELDASGASCKAPHAGLDWRVDPKSLEGDEAGSRRARITRRADARPDSAGTSSSLRRRREASLERRDAVVR